MEKFKLPVHKHPLHHVGGNQIKGNKGVLLFCDGCYGQAHLDSGYGCSQCPLYYLHKKCGESVPEINHPSHPEHPLHLLVDMKGGDNKSCHLCGVTVKVLCYHCPICDFTIDSGCAINPPLPIIEKPKAHDHTLALMSTTDTDATCHVCGEKHCYAKYLYLCSVCDLVFHIECASLSPEINHPSHPRHLLKLLQGESSMISSHGCTLCGVVKSHRNCYQNCYHCFICNFTIDVRCVKNPPPLSLVSPRTHKHQLTCLPRRMCFTCNTCGMQGEESPYVCIQCNFLIHRSCIDLPRVIWINRHDHRISHTYDMDNIGTLDLECGVCHQTIDPFYGAYSCFECKDFFVHSRCATKYNLWDGRDLEGEPEEIEDVAPFKVKGDNLIEHFSHEEHDMEFIEEGSVDRENIVCRACIKHIGADGFYKCTQCEFFLHERCANIPRKIRSVMAPKKLTLLGGVLYFHDAFYCRPCRRYSSGFRFQMGHYIVDIHCVTTRDILKREAHPHHLYFFALEVTKCTACDTEVNYGFTCFKGDCVFSLCYTCATIPETVKHKSDDHTLRLCYQEYGNGKYWCDICEKEVDFYKQYYTCDECGTTFHIKCVLGDMCGSLLPGSIITHKETAINWEYKFEAVANTGVNRPRCCICHSRCTFSLVLKTHDDLNRYVCSYDCVRIFSSL